MTTFFFLLLILSIILFNNIIICQALTQEEERELAGPSIEMYCGTSWPNAANACLQGCPEGTNDECSNLGLDYECHFFTGCSAKVDPIEDDEDIEEDNSSNSATSNNRCGKTWLHAMLSCTQECPLGNECTIGGERCFAATNCDKPLVELMADILTTMRGPDQLMEPADTAILESTINDIMQEVAGEDGVSLRETVVGDQQLVSARKLQQRYDHRVLMGHDSYLGLDLKVGNITQRMLPSGSSAIDVSMVVTGDYRPPPYLDLDVIAEDSINRQGAKVVSTLRERGERAGREFFSRVEGIEAVRKTELTKRPSKSPIRTPTASPMGEPTSIPSSMPTDSPTSVPSTEPSRQLENVIMTGSREDLQLGAESTSSYGYIFNIRTKPDAPVIAMTGFDFYTETTDMVNYEVWSRLGSFQEYKGTYDGWDLIAFGSVKGRGIGRYTAIPEETFTPVSIPGGGESRAFYLTLDTINLVYKYGTKGEPSDTKYHHDSPDIEIWEGEGVLFYPFPDPSEAYFYRAPRQYLGAIYYDRLWCKPYSLYGDLDKLDEMKCPRVPTQSPTLTPPTMAPITELPTVSPVESTPEPTDNPTVTPGTPTHAPYIGQTPEPINPTEDPTLSPTVSSRPTPVPTTAGPTISPVVPMRANIVTTLRNVPQRNMTPRELEKYIDILTTFLRRHTDSSMVLAGIDYWHQELALVDAKEGTVVEVAKEGMKTRGANTRYLAEEEGEGVEGHEEEEIKGLWREEDLPTGWVKKPEVIPQVDAMEITLILLVSFANLPEEVLGSLANVAIEENEQELLDLLKEQRAFYTFFKRVDGVSSISIDKVTPPPTPDPTTAAHYEAILAAQEAQILEEESVEESGMGFAVFIGLGIGFLWCCLTAISVAYLMSARGEMEEQRDMENLLKAEKADPLKDNPEGSTDSDDVNDENDNNTKNRRSLRRGSTVPMGDSDDKDMYIKRVDSDETDDPFDQTKNARLAPKTRVELSKSQMANKSSIRRSSETSGKSDLEEIDEEKEMSKIASSYNPTSTRRQSRKDQGATATARWSAVVTGVAIADADDNQDATRRHSTGDNARRSEQRARAKSMIQQSGDGGHRRSGTHRGSAVGRASMRASTNINRASTSSAESPRTPPRTAHRASVRGSGNRGSANRASMRASSTSATRREGDTMMDSGNLGASDNKASIGYRPKPSSRTRPNSREEGGDLRNSDSNVRRKDRRSSSKQRVSQSMIG